MVGSLSLASCVDGPVPVAIECMRADVAAEGLPDAVQSGDDTLLPLGLCFGDGEVCVVDVPDGEHVLIIGPPRSGRSTALQRMVRAWTTAHPDGWWRIVAPRRTVFGDDCRFRSLADILDDIPTTGRVLIAVDDAELVDDVDGAFAALAATDDTA